MFMQTWNKSGIYEFEGGKEYHLEYAISLSVITIAA